MVPSSTNSLDRFRAQARALRERPGSVSGGEVEQALNDVYAEVIALEATRTRLRRRQQEHMADVLAADGGERLREDVLAIRALDAAIAALREVLGELRALPVELPPPEAPPDDIPA
jgi:hypothetical protein